MLLTARILSDTQGINSFRISPGAHQATEGDTYSVYLQLIDASLDTTREGFNPAGRRYVPASGASLSITMDAISTAKAISRAAVQPFAQDSSIWRLDVLSTDKLRGTVPLKLVLTEGVKVTRGLVQAGILVQPRDQIFTPFAP